LSSNVCQVTRSYRIVGNLNTQEIIKTQRKSYTMFLWPHKQGSVCNGDNSVNRIERMKGAGGGGQHPDRWPIGYSQLNSSWIWCTCSNSLDGYITTVLILGFAVRKPAPLYLCLSLDIDVRSYLEFTINPFSIHVWGQSSENRINYNKMHLNYYETDTYE
jgi:hypothetical protein